MIKKKGVRGERKNRERSKNQIQIFTENQFDAKWYSDENDWTAQEAVFSDQNLLIEIKSG